MSDAALYWFFLNLGALVALSFFSMFEMAAVSFNRVRLQYEVTNKKKKAIWLYNLLSNPSLLFGTTLVGVNTFLVIGSEAARELFIEFGLSPIWASLYEIIIVVILGELTPMFAARRYPEHVAMLGVSFIYGTSKILMPFLWFVNQIVRGIQYCLGWSEVNESLQFGREELIHLLEEQEEPQLAVNHPDQWNRTIVNIFSAGEKPIEELMHPLVELCCLSPFSTVHHLQNTLKTQQQPFFPLIQEKKRQVLGVVYVKDLLRAASTRRLRDYARQPSFVDSKMKLMQLLKQMQKGDDELAFVIDEKAQVIGYVTCDHVISAIFGVLDPSSLALKERRVVVQRTVSAGMTLGEVAEMENVHLKGDPKMTLTELFVEKFGHAPESGDSIVIGPYELTVKEASLLEVKTVTIATRLL